MGAAFNQRLPKRLAALAGAILALTSSAAIGAGIQTGTVSGVQVNKYYSGGVITFIIQGPTPTGKPTCADHETNRWTLKTSDGNILNDDYYAALLTAVSTGKTVRITGAGTCSVIPWLEDADSVDLGEAP